MASGSQLISVVQIEHVMDVLPDDLVEIEVFDLRRSASLRIRILLRTL